MSGSAMELLREESFEYALLRAERLGTGRFGAAGAGALADQLRRNADGDLGRRLRADIEPHGRVYRRELLGGDAVINQGLKRGTHPPAAADHAQIEGPVLAGQQ